MNSVVERLCRGQVLAEGFFDNHPAPAPVFLGKTGLT